jgi:hypothetical protein
VIAIDVIARTTRATTILPLLLFRPLLDGEVTEEEEEEEEDEDDDDDDDDGEEE